MFKDLNLTKLSAVKYQINPLDLNISKKYLGLNWYFVKFIEILFRL